MASMCEGLLIGNLRISNRNATSWPACDKLHLHSPEDEMVIQDTYHGQQIPADGRAIDAPPMPEDRPGHLPEIILHGTSIQGLEIADIRRIRDAGAPDPERTYPHVQMVGNFGLGCIDTQTLNYYDIEPSDAHRLAWEAFGRCVHVISYFDEDECLVAGE